jgi:flagellar assembly protein FliH
MDMSGFEPIKISKVSGTSSEFSDMSDARPSVVDEDGFAPIGNSSLFEAGTATFASFDDKNSAAESAADAKDHSSDEALREVRDEYFEQGRLEGFEAGRKEVEEELKAAQKLRERLESVREQVFARSVKDVADAVILIARQVVRRELKASPGSIKDLVISVLEQVRRSDEFVIRLSADEHSKLSELTPLIMNRLGRDASFRVEVDPKLEAGGIVVETDYGRIDASVEAQVEAFADVVDSWAREEVEVGDD